MAPLDYAHLKTLAGAATPGPWQVRFIARLFKAAREHPEYLVADAPETDWPNAEFIVAAREALPGLVAEVERLTRDLALTKAKRGRGTYWCLDCGARKGGVTSMRCKPCAGRYLRKAQGAWRHGNGAQP